MRMTSAFCVLFFLFASLFFTPASSHVPPYHKQLDYCPYHFPLVQKLTHLSSYSKCSKDTHSNLRYFLYDVKIGEGFNLQKDVFYRAALTVAALNEKLILHPNTTHTHTHTHTPPTWVLVLPPWCLLAHWTRDMHDASEKEKRKRWASFFDMSVVSQVLSVLEYDEYVHTVQGGEHVVDTAWILDWARDPLKKEMKDRQIEVHSTDDFVQCKNQYNPWRYTNQAKESAANSRPVLQRHPHAIGYSGWCNDINAHSVHCIRGERPFSPRTVSWLVTQVSESPIEAKFIDPHTWQEPRGEFDALFARMLTSGDSKEYPRSVFVKYFDNIMVPFGHDLAPYHLQDALFFSGRLRHIGDSYINRFLENKYIALHMRRGDFTRVRTKETPPIIDVAKRIAHECRARAASAAGGGGGYTYTRVFVSTDAPQEERDELRALVGKMTDKKVQVVYLKDSIERGDVAGLVHPGDIAIVDQWIAVRADKFIGTQESVFTRNIMHERGLMGHSKANTLQVLCGPGAEATAAVYETCLAVDRMPLDKSWHRRGYFP